jgi:type I restriction enzyme R subunit
MLRSGAEVANPGEKYQRVHFINWDKDQRHLNEFAIAEEVTILGNQGKRPDIVLYLNGIAVGVLELKRSSVSIGDGVRQSIVNQQEGFIQPFFTTLQLIMAGNDARACATVPSAPRRSFS